MRLQARKKQIKEAIGLFKRAYWPFKFHIFVLVVFGFFGGILEGIGINALIPLFSFITGKGEGGSDFISRMIEQFFLYVGADFRLRNILILIVALFLAKAAILLYLQYIKITISGAYEQQTRSKLFSRILEADWPYLLKQRMGHFENVIMMDVRMASGLLKHISSIIILTTSLLMYVLVALNISLTITIITIALGALLFLIFKPLLYRTRKLAEKTSATNKEVARFVNEHFIGFKAIKSAGDVYTALIERAHSYFEYLKKLGILKTFFKEAMTSFWQPVSIVFVCVVFAVTYKTQNFNIAAFAAILYLIHRMFGYIQQLQAQMHGVNAAVPHLQQVLVNEEKAVRHKEQDEGLEPFHFDKTLSFINVHFSYPEKKDVLRGVDFVIRQGEMIGIVGPSGSGKTTIFDLLLRLFKPDQGRIEIDDTNISGIRMKAWRLNIAYVSQDMFLTNDTIANNIRFYDASIDDAKMLRAVKMAQIYDVIQGYPEKFEKIVGERGILFSVGQRQRIVIARALARNPSILFLDEATSALDNESEVAIQKVIERLKGSMTVIVVAHRLSTIMNSDRLFILDNGKIVEQGSPNSLLQNKQSYFYKVSQIRR